MRGGNTNSPPPCGIDIDTIEMYVLGNLRDEAAYEHIEACKICGERVVEHASWIAVLRQALREYVETEPASTRKGRGASAMDSSQES